MCFRHPLKDPCWHNRPYNCLEYYLGCMPDERMHTAGCQKLSDLHAVRHLTNLRELDLSQTDASDSGLFRIAAMSQLSRLSLRDTKVSANALRLLASLPDLMHLDLSHTSIHQGLRNLGAPRDAQFSP